MASVAGNKRRHKENTIEVKYAALKELERGVSNKDVSEKFNIPKNTLSTWKKNKDKIIAAFKSSGGTKRQRIKEGTYEHVNLACYKWLLLQRSENIPINGVILQEKALDFAKKLNIEKFQASDGWLHAWKARYNISFKEVSGESKSVTPEMTNAWNETSLPTIMSRFKLRDIYNADEFGLFYQGLPTKTLHLKGQKCQGGKHSKVRITGMAAANALGEKLPMFVIGKSAKPRCFKNIASLPCRYRSQQKSWMNSFLFDEWVKELDKVFERENRKVVLIVDNCTAHPSVEGLKAIELVFLPPNTTSKTQPMDQGVIRSLKAKYRKKIIQRFIRAVDTKKALPKTSILNAMQLLTSAWNEVTEVTIKNCFKKVGISENSAEEAINEEDDPFKDLEEAINDFRERLPDDVPEDFNASVLIDVDDELSTTGSTQSDAEILAEVMGDAGADKEVDDDVDFYDESPTHPSSHEVESAIEILQRLSLFYNDGDELRKLISKADMHAQKAFMAKKKQKTIKDFF